MCPLFLGWRHVLTPRSSPSLIYAKHNTKVSITVETSPLVDRCAEVSVCWYLNFKVQSFGRQSKSPTLNCVTSVAFDLRVSISYITKFLHSTELHIYKYFLFIFQSSVFFCFLWYFSSWPPHAISIHSADSRAPKLAAAVILMSFRPPFVSQVSSQQRQRWASPEVHSHSLAACQL